MLAALDPLLGRENARSQLDQAREHIEDGDGPPFLAEAGAEAAAIELVGNLADGNVLNDELHHGKKELHLGRFFSEMFAIPGDLITEGSFDGAGIGGGRFGHGGPGFALPFDFPFDADEAPAFLLAFADVIGIERALYRFANALELSHRVLRDRESSKFLTLGQMPDQSKIIPRATRNATRPWGQRAWRGERASNTP